MWTLLRFVHQLVAGSLSEVALVCVALAMGGPVPLELVPMLWLGVVSEIVPAMARATTPAPGGHGRARFDWALALRGALIWASVVTALAVAWARDARGALGPGHSITIAFVTLALVQIAQAFHRPSLARPVAEPPLARRWLLGAAALSVSLLLAALYVPSLRELLRTVALDTSDWALVGACALAPIIVMEIAARARSRPRRHARSPVHHRAIGSPTHRRGRRSPRRPPWWRTGNGLARRQRGGEIAPARIRPID
jgi:P-type Ca2+ transporter type 2C